ncbi:DUF3016 domain-containing protein [Paraferrimonas sp. SM1919]|uniref:DUF3016 domain-containing protein n=1 Tax=Paraferrimonas sp. SM1919 TaxID=2662263 RepID=UPI0013D5EBF4|nr:DUF3016 domain-containing protein [Paraferrimonas sp. SM1919]
MKLSKIILLISTLAMAGFASAENKQEAPTYTNGAVTMVWQNPDDYRDVRAASELQSRYQERAFRVISKEFSKQVEKILSAGQTLEITVSDLDLAGDVKPTFGEFGSDNIRIVESLYPPAIKFDFKLLENGKVIASGKEELRDLGFDHRIRRAGSGQNKFYFETRMLMAWANNTFKAN